MSPKGYLGRLGGVSPALVCNCAAAPRNRAILENPSDFQSSIDGVEYKKNHKNKGIGIKNLLPKIVDIVYSFSS